MKIQGDNMQLLTSDGASTYLEGNASSGVVTLYHASNAPRIATTATGVDVTGNVVVSGTVDGVDIAASNTLAVAALPKAGGAMTGAITTNSTFDGVDIAVRDAVLTSTTTTANAALPKAGGTVTGKTSTNELELLAIAKDISDTAVDVDGVKYMSSLKYDPDHWAIFAALLSLIPAVATLFFGGIGFYRQTDQWKEEADQLKEETASRSTWSGLTAALAGYGIEVSDSQLVDAVANLELSPLEFAWVVANGGLMHADVLLRDAGVTNAAIRIKLLMACSGALQPSEDALLLHAERSRRPWMSI
jgi:hypothetical protein